MTPVLLLLALAAPPEGLDLLLNGDSPIRLELRVTVAGKPVERVWDETFARLHAYHDRNGDGGLDRAEAARLPSAFGLRQLLWGQFLTTGGTAPAFEQLDRDGDGKVSQDELADSYRRAGLGGVLVGVGKPPASERLTAALVQALDTNRDGRVSAAECQAAPDLLRTLDATDDELLGPGELVPHATYPGALGAVLVTPGQPAEGLPFSVLSPGTHTGAPAATWRVRLGEAARQAYTSPTLRLDLRSDAGTLAEQTAAARKRFLARFAECDANGDNVLDARELATPKGAHFRHLADGSLRAAEFTAWLDVQEQIAKGHVLLTVLDHGPGLFEFLDADHDGGLSRRELRTAWDRLRAAGCVTDGAIDRAKLPRQLRATVAHGHPRTALGKPARIGPAWFLALDRNGDGDVSLAEWPGEVAAFRKLDTDGDGLLSPEEAAK